eukprot:7530945-Alexandrium_andersonii.AAC.1
MLECAGCGCENLAGWGQCSTCAFCLLPWHGKCSEIVANHVEACGLTNPDAFNGVGLPSHFSDGPMCRACEHHLADAVHA